MLFSQYWQLGVYNPGPHSHMCMKWGGCPHGMYVHFTQSVLDRCTLAGLLHSTICLLQVCGWFIGSVCIVVGRDKGQLFLQQGFLKPANWPLLEPHSEWFRERPMRKSSQRRLDRSARPQLRAPSECGSQHSALDAVKLILAL